MGRRIRRFLIIIPAAAVVVFSLLLATCSNEFDIFDAIKTEMKIANDLFLVVSYIAPAKNSISSAIGTELDAWLEAHADLDTYIVVGDCTDLCTYQLAMHLRLRANALQLDAVRVVLPLDGVDTYDLPPSVAGEIGAVPHDGDLLHLIFAYSMMLNGKKTIAQKNFYDAMDIISKKIKEDP